MVTLRVSQEQGHAVCMVFKDKMVIRIQGSQGYKDPMGTVKGVEKVKLSQG